MLNQTTLTLQFQPPVTKIIQLSQAYNQTFILLVYVLNQKSNMIYHVDRFGFLIKQYSARFAFNRFAMIDHDKVMIPNMQQEQIEVINLRTQQIVTIPHKFLQHISELQFLTFSMSKILCVKEIQGYEDKQLKITFYQCSEFEKPVKIAEYQRPKVNQYRYISKTNNISSILFYNQKNYQTVDFIAIDLVYQKQSTGLQLRERSFSINIDNHQGRSLKNMGSLPIWINYLWEIREDEFIIIGLAFNHKIPTEREDCSLKVLSLKQKAIKSSKIVIPGKYQLTGEIYLFDQYIGIDVVKDYKHQDDQQIIYTLFLNSTEEQIDIITQRSQKFQPSKYFNGIQGHKFIRARYSNYHVQQAKITILQPISIKNAYLQMLLHINPDFDDDLLQDTMQLLNVPLIL